MAGNTRALFRGDTGDSFRRGIFSASHDRARRASGKTNAYNWVPAPFFWGYLTGAALLVCGACIVVNKKARLAAIYLGIVILFFVVFSSTSPSQSLILPT